MFDAKIVVIYISTLREKSTAPTCGILFFVVLYGSSLFAGEIVTRSFDPSFFLCSDLTSVTRDQTDGTNEAFSG